MVASHTLAHPSPHPPSHADGRYFPTLLLFGDTSIAKPGSPLDAPPPPPFGLHDVARGFYCCRTGVPEAGFSAQVCIERVAPLAVGRVGVLLIADDYLAYPWRLDKLDTRRVWAMPVPHDLRFKVATGGAGAEGPRKGSNPGAWDFNVEWWAEKYQPAEAQAMAARNFAASAPPSLRKETARLNLTRPLMRVASGHSDWFYLPRAIVPLWGDLFAEEKAISLMQEHAIPSAILATARLTSVYTLQGSLGPGRNVSTGWVDFGTWVDGTHPWKFSIPPLREKALSEFRTRGYAV